MQYTQYYCTELLHKIYYFCLKKTGNETEAAELSGEISLHIMQELGRGVIPRHFHGWVWRIVRNRYARWAASRKKAVNRMYSGDIADIESSIRQPGVLTDSGDLSQRMIRIEELQLLRRELAFIRSDYRDLLVAYYIRGQKIKNIASKLGLSENTVKTRLYNSRKKLKEGMDMVRQYGKLSYDPEHISFGYSVYTAGENGEPYSLVRRMISKNMLIELSRNPSTSEELALEMGIAVPYIEDELNNLLESSLIGKEGERYVCNIVILSRDVQNVLYARFLKSLAAFSFAVRNVVEAKKAYCRKHGQVWTTTTLEEEDRKWGLISYEFGRILRKMQQEREGNEMIILRKMQQEREGNEMMDDAERLAASLTKRPNSGIWDMLGKESCPELEPIDYWTGNDAIDEGGTTYVLYMNDVKFRKESITELTPQEDEALDRAITRRSMSDDVELLQRLEQLGYVVEAPGTETGQGQALPKRYLPACLDMNREIWEGEAERCEEVIQAYRHAVQLYRNYYDYSYQKIAGSASGNDRVNLHFATKSFLGGLFPMLVTQSLEDGYLKYSHHKMVGVVHLHR